MGLLLVEVREFDIVEASLTEVQGQISNYALFSKMVTPHSTIFFEEAEVALNNALKISRGELSPELQQLLGELASYKGRVVLGVADPKLAGRISEQLKLKTVSNAVVNEILRGVRTHFAHLMKKEGLAADMLEKAQLGMGHSVSRSRIALDVNREDKPIIQGINLIELLDKDLNTLSMRIREWYGWHFPELSKIIPESYTYIKLVKAIGSRDRTQVSLEDLEAIVGNEEVISNLVEAMKVSMGQ